MRETYRMLDGLIEKKHDEDTIKGRCCHGQGSVEGEK